MQRLFVLLGVVIVFALIFGLMFAYYRSQQSRRRLRWVQPRKHGKSKTTPFSSPRRQKPYDSEGSGDSDSAIRIEQVSRPLQKKLLLLLHGDRQAANRLLSAAKDRNPGRTIQWYAEKVLFDLQRDYGKY
ncbi:hypothetical protein [Chroococcidiopsis sp.]|uniref:hypothetical protein n=1 Tax=Chroococcidiopsis sp. TaxID=3088168 RepID=UPI003F2A757A